ncbi:hypothetical protein G6F31_011781 [Rhizopus arrhizus]|nr:hypothetical protein G6F31_011781 [Rhizopus arrhizus]
MASSALSGAANCRLRVRTRANWWARSCCGAATAAGTLSMQAASAQAGECDVMCCGRVVTALEFLLAPASAPPACALPVRAARRAGRTAAVDGAGQRRRCQPGPAHPAVAAGQPRRRAGPALPPGACAVPVAAGGSGVRAAAPGCGWLPAQWPCHRPAPAALPCHLGLVAAAVGGPGVVAGTRAPSPGPAAARRGLRPGACRLPAAGSTAAQRHARPVVGPALALDSRPLARAGAGAGPAVPAGHRCVGLAGVAASAAIAHRDAAGPTVPVVDAAADLPATGAESFHMAFRDELTGLPGRRAFNETVQRARGTYSIAMVDVDHFKSFNDTHGHDTGDDVLRLVASRLSRVGDGGRAFRYGGEEFVVVFLDRPAAACVDAVEALRQSIEATRMQLRDRSTRSRDDEAGRQQRGRGGNGQVVQVTVSIGLADSREDPRPAAVIKAADQALYRAKDGGRNQVRAHAGQRVLAVRGG